MNLLVCGVGGQGVLLFSRVVAHLALTMGLDVKMSEVHGMAQRGGSVTSHIRWGKRVFSPLIEEGTADVVVAFEQLEALRYIHFLAKTGKLFYDPLRIEPLPVQLGLVEGLSESAVGSRLSALGCYPVPAFKLACELGEPRIQNTVMLGAISPVLEFPFSLYQDVFRSLIKPQHLKINLRALTAGRQMMEHGRQGTEHILP